jgi:ATP phosphoribosyltransferase
LPKGKMLNRTADFLNTIGLGFNDYNSSTRIYRMWSQSMPSMSAKMLNERDIPIQVAIGNYDFGICSSDWLQELLSRYPASRVYKVADLGFDISEIYLACTAGSRISQLQIIESTNMWRIVTEYPALAEAAANKMRLKKFRIFPLWGSAEAYPPENADFAVLRVNNKDDLSTMNLRPISKVADSSACIIANLNSIQTGDFKELLSRFTSGINLSKKPWQAKETAKPSIKNNMSSNEKNDKDGVWLALADGHQQSHTTAFLSKTGIKLDGYSKDNLKRRPSCNLDWINIKVVRPQDMPQQVANGNFDLAITGKDWLLDHLYQFPSSPVTELVNLGFGWVKVVAVVCDDVPAETIEDIRKLINKGQFSPLRIATEYVNIADKFLRDKHIARYRVIPTWGATEVYLPEDADMLIENTETGQTLIRHKLKIIDTLFESTACLIGNRRSFDNPAKRKKIEKLIKMFQEAAGKK